MPINKSLYNLLSAVLTFGLQIRLNGYHPLLVLSFAEGVRGGQEGIVRPSPFFYPELVERKGDTEGPSSLIVNRRPSTFGSV